MNHGKLKAALCRFFNCDNADWYYCSWKIAVVYPLIDCDEEKLRENKLDKIAAGCCEEKKRCKILMLITRNTNSEAITTSWNPGEPWKTRKSTQVVFLKALLLNWLKKYIYICAGWLDHVGYTCLKRSWNTSRTAYLLTKLAISVFLSFFLFFFTSFVR